MSKYAMALGVGLLVAGCGQEAGTAEPEGDPISGEQSNGIHDGVLALDSCEILDVALEGEGFDPGEPPDVRSDRSCRSRKLGDVSVTVELGETPFDLLEGEVYEGTVNGRDARMAINPIEGASDGHCGISMKVDESERALVLVTQSNRDTDEACDYAERIAERVEVQLPGGEP
ncbi:DUF3558 domain-containing protein [Haloechinothrix sp. LS1_15]|nr:DUF3558 domain-containing protein [Haloechinothrix sp. LS1_15]